MFFFSPSPIERLASDCPCYVCVGVCLMLRVKDRGQLIRLDEHNVGAGRAAGVIFSFRDFHISFFSFLEMCWIVFFFLTLLLASPLPPLVSFHTWWGCISIRYDSVAPSRSSPTRPRFLSFPFLILFFPVRPSSRRPPLVHDDRCFCISFLFVLFFFFV